MRRGRSILLHSVPRASRSKALSTSFLQSSFSRHEDQESLSTFAQTIKSTFAQSPTGNKFLVVTRIQFFPNESVVLKIIMKILNSISSTSRYLKHRALAAGLGLGLAAGTAMAAPANDDFASAIDLTGAASGQTGSVSTGNQMGTNTDAATFQTGEPDPESAFAINSTTEDNAHGLFRRYNGPFLVTFGTLATQSFHKTKKFNCGDGGALLLNDRALSDRAEIILDKGTNRSRSFHGQVDKYTWVNIGSSFLMSDILVGNLFAQFETSGEIQTFRRRIWTQYARGLEDWASRNRVRLPFYNDLTEEHLDRVVSGLKSFRIG